jgi:hypothetical protein
LLTPKGRKPWLEDRASTPLVGCGPSLLCPADAVLML